MERFEKANVLFSPDTGWERICGTVQTFLALFRFRIDGKVSAWYLPKIPQNVEKWCKWVI